MRKIARFIAPLAAVLLMPTGAQAVTTQTWTYVAATVVSCGGGICNAQVGDTRAAPLGAFLVTPSSTSVTLDVDDAAGPGNEVSLCQENTFSGSDLQNFCGDGADDISVFKCATGAPQIIGGWKAGNSLLISLFAASVDCSGVGTTGTAKVTF